MEVHGGSSRTDTVIVFLWGNVSSTIVRWILLWMIWPYRAVSGAAAVVAHASCNAPCLSSKNI